jgi:hypothetical protein
LASWRALFGEDMPAEEAERYERHLESCLLCQERLDRGDVCREAWRRLGRRDGDPTLVPTDPWVLRVLDRLRDGQGREPGGVGGAADLYFLRPGDQPGVLGTLGDYEVRGVIGEGGMGLVLKAFDPALQRLVAIKVLAPALAASPTARRRFTREAQAAASVCHEYVVAVHGVHEADELPYLVMHYVAGESLQQRLDRVGPLPAEEVVRIGSQAAWGLAAAHARGLIHRDVKPANLLLEDGLDQVKITDFGLARTADGVGLTQTGVVAGTPGYMAPEQARGEAVDHRADLFALGAVLYACCTGQPPFRAATPLAVLRQVNEQAPPPVRELNPDVPAWLEALIDRLLAKEPARRVQTAAEVATLLESYLAHLRQPASVAAPELPAVPDGPGPECSPGKAGSGLARWVFRPEWAVLVVVALVTLALSHGLLGQAVPETGREPVKEFYQDFRGAQPLHPALKLVGPDADEVARPEAEGLRITLPATRPVNQPVEVVATFTVSGDFEITGTFELLSADHPTKGYGVGVSLNVADSDARNDFVKVARAKLVQAGSVFHSESWSGGPGNNYRKRTKPTEARLGQLRLVRKGAGIRYQAAEGLGGDFQEIDAQDQFGTEDMAHVHFVVADSGTPGNAVDARLVDLRIRAANLIPDPTAGAAPAVAAAGPARPSGSRGWLVGAGILALVVLASVAAGLAVRRRPRKVPVPAAGPDMAKPQAAAPAVSVQCPGCGKALKARPELAGKRVKCPQCGKAVQVPGARAAGPGGAP